MGNFGFFEMRMDVGDEEVGVRVDGIIFIFLGVVIIFNWGVVG